MVADVTHPIVEVVICTYNRAAGLRRTLDTLAAQSAERDGTWLVTVVDNNCTDGTVAVVDAVVSGGKVPGLRRVQEPRQGLVEARQRGFHATTGPWLAFVDDDCELAHDWVEAVLVFIASNPGAAGFNGRNTLAFDGAARFVHPEMFAGFDAATLQPITVGWLHGAGLVLRRAAVVRSGWLDDPALPDRRGKRLISGGDNELAARAKAGADGGELWFVPSCRLVHRVGRSRTRLRYLIRLNFALAQAQPQMYAITEKRGERIWRRRMVRAAAGHVGRACGLPQRFVSRDHLAVPGSGIGGHVLSIARCSGFVAGLARLLLAPRRRRASMIGLATIERVEANCRKRE